MSKALNADIEEFRDYLRRVHQDHQQEDYQHERHNVVSRFDSLIDRARHEAHSEPQSISTNPYRVKAGQLWADVDGRGRTFRVRQVRGEYAICEVVRPNANTFHTPTNTRILLSRFRATPTKGYRLIEDVKG